MVFISAVVANERVGLELNVITLDSKWKNFPDGKPVFKVPLLYTGILAKHTTEKVADITHIEIQMQQSLQQESVFAVKISTFYRNNPKSKDKVSILLIDADELRNAKL